MSLLKFKKIQISDFEFRYKKIYRPILIVHFRHALELKNHGILLIVIVLFFDDIGWLSS